MALIFKQVRATFEPGEPEYSKSHVGKSQSGKSQTAP